MNMELSRIAQASNLALVRACRRLVKGGCDGEATRAWSLAEHWREVGKVAISTNAAKIAQAPARQVVRQLSLILAKSILKAELNNETTSKG